jgi:hypothetical protein
MTDHHFNERIEFLKNEIKELETSNNLLFMVFFGSFLLNFTLIINIFWG